MYLGKMAHFLLFFPIWYPPYSISQAQDPFSLEEKTGILMQELVDKQHMAVRCLGMQLFSQSLTSLGFSENLDEKVSARIFVGWS